MFIVMVQGWSQDFQGGGGQSNIKVPWVNMARGPPPLPPGFATDGLFILKFQYYTDIEEMPEFLKNVVIELNTRHTTK